MRNLYFIPVLLLVYITCYLLLYPMYQYIFDLDAIGYLSVTKRLAAGDFQHGINAFWPPLQSWLAIPFYKAGMNEFVAIKTLNGTIGAGILIVMNRLLLKANIQPTLRQVALYVCIPILISYAYSQLSADILLCLLLLVYVDIITEKDLFENRYKNIAAGLVGCLCYLAKTYALPFFFLHFVILQWVLYKRSVLPIRKKLLATNLLMGMGCFILLAAPWVYILYNRYDILTLGHVFIFGKSGQFNLSYYFQPTGYVFTQMIVGPPAGMCCDWENPLPYLMHQPQYYGHLFTFSMVVEQFRDALYNFTIALKLLSVFSFLCPAIITALGLYVIQKKDGFLTQLLLFILVLPAGYLLLHVEDRFLWSINFLAMIAGLLLIQRIAHQVPIKRPVRILFWCLFFASFLISPIDNLKDWRNLDANIFQLANELKAKGIKGKFLSAHATDVPRLAYLTGSYYYRPGPLNYTYTELFQAAREQGIDYFFYYYQNTQELDAFRQTVFYKNALQEINTKMPNLLLLKMK